MKKYAYLLLFLALAGCKKGEKHQNQPPDTHIAFKEINLSGEDRLNSEVRLSWYGTDEDGFIAGYELSTDKVNWHFTTSQDSLIQFPLEKGQDTTDVEFYVRAIDNQSERDPDPAHLRVPLKNTPPSSNFIEEALPADTSHLVVTFSWEATDPDGDESITSAFLKVNNGNWQEFPLSANILTIVPESPETQGTGNARFYYNGQYNESRMLDGFNNGGMNTFYLKVADFAAAESEVDTSNEIYITHQTSPELLWVTGQDETVSSEYKTMLTAYNYDFLDYGASERHPKFWQPEFNLILEQYNMVFVSSGAGTFTNPFSQRSGLLLDFMAPAMQQFFGNGGKAFITTAFVKGTDLSELSEVFPIQSISSSNGHARAVPDSVVYPVTNSNWPSVSPTNQIIGISPFTPTPDAETIYKAELTKIQGWTGPDVVGATKSNAGQELTQVFFSIEIHDFDKDPAAQQQLIDNMFTELGF